MPTAGNKALVRRMIEDLVNERHLELVEELFAPTFASDGRAATIEQIRQAVARHHVDFTGFHIAIDEMVAEGDAVVVRGVIRGTHTGETLVGGISVPATGKPAAWRLFVLFRVADGRITKELALGDDLGLLQQLGAVRAPGAAAVNS